MQNYYYLMLKKITPPATSTSRSNDNNTEEEDDDDDDDAVKFSLECFADETQVHLLFKIDMDDVEQVTIHTITLFKQNV